ncbi:16235_t:CDS:2 [Acaulospora colombiana]|uniref:16235_t:CDS:1 n=1 Tax=Acaulospora colombiana TaxID=27376 RepID=A0ACA9LL74_9GLOM|nr:16235_t:CDS:2 [Acaulospora colombiana]
MSSPKSKDLEGHLTREVQTITNGNSRTSVTDVEEDVVAKDNNDTNFIFTNIDKDQFYQLSKTLADFYDREMNNYSDITRALYDFRAENPSELSFQEGDILLIQDRQCAGWLIADLGEETGLVPENYVALLGDDEEEEDEYGDWANEEQQ